MSIRCKKGDLAIIVRSLHGNEGKIVRVLEFIGTQEFLSGAVRPNCWLVQCKSLSGWCETSQRQGGDGVIADAWLRPIRDNGGDDETIRIAGKPSEVHS